MRKTADIPRKVSGSLIGLLFCASAALAHDAPASSGSAPAPSSVAPASSSVAPTSSSAAASSSATSAEASTTSRVQPTSTSVSVSGSGSVSASTSEPGKSLTANSAKPAMARGKKVSRGNPPSSSWLPGEKDPPVRAALLCIHGLGLHNETYEPFGKRMAQLGIATYALDMRGFGSYRQAKGHEEVDFDGCLDDLYRSLRSIRRAQPGKPVYLLGESMGGAIALHAMALRPELIDGLITSVPAGDRYKQGRTSLKVALNFIKDRNKAINVGEGVVNQATAKPELRQAWMSDPLARMMLTPMELLQFQQFMNQNHDFCKDIKDKPVLVVYGCLDKLVKPEGTEELYKEMATPDKEIYPVANAEHLIFEENQFTQEVVDRVNGWLSSRIDGYAIAKQDISRSVAEKKPMGQQGL